MRFLHAKREEMKSRGSGVRGGSWRRKAPPTAPSSIKTTSSFRPTFIELNRNKGGIPYNVIFRFLQKCVISTAKTSEAQF